MGRKQFKRTSEKSQSIDRRVLRFGQSRVIAITKVIPAAWSYVRIIPLESTGEHVILEIQKLLAIQPNSKPKTTEGTA